MTNSKLPYFVGIILEKVNIQYTGNAQQQVGINTLAGKNIIDIGAVAIDILCKPRYGPALTTQFRFDNYADMYCLLFGHCAKQNSADKFLISTA